MLTFCVKLFFRVLKKSHLELCSYDFNVVTSSDDCGNRDVTQEKNLS